MRLLLKISPLKSIEYDLNYHYSLQGLIYGILQNSKYDYIHDKHGYKFFCYSNIFPFENILSNEKSYSLLISSPDSQIIKTLYENMVIGTKFTIRKMEFNISASQMVEIKIPDYPFTISSGTPVVIRIRSEKSQNFNRQKNYKYHYWRKIFPIDIFIKQITNNLSKKYLQYHNITDKEKSLKVYPLFESLFHKFKFKKQVSNVVYMKKSSHVVIGSLWEFGFEGWEDKESLKFALDCGLGERNSLGFGFINIIDSHF